MDLIDRILPGLQAKAREQGYDTLSHAERVVLDVTAVEADVNNGGFHQFFYNDSGDRVKEGIAALHAGFAYRFTRNEVESLARSINRDLLWDDDETDYPHATFVKTGCPSVR